MPLAVWPQDQYQAPALGGALTVAAWDKSTLTAVVLATPSQAQVTALLNIGYTVIDMSKPAQWSMQFSQHPMFSVEQPDSCPE